MALASYGRADPKAIAELIHVRPDGTFLVNQAFVNPRFSSSRGERLSDSFRTRSGTARRSGEPLHQGHADLAATLRAATEVAVVAFVARAMRLTRCRRVCLGGGVALNSVANHGVRVHAAPADLFVGPAANDAGSALGAAMDLYSSRTGLRPVIEERVYLGPQFDDQEVCRAFARVGVSNHEKLNDPPATAARLLSAGNIIGWFQGRMETGPRALGNRSILADPRNADVRRRINEEIKGREEFRPFAPVVLEEYQVEWFEPSGVASPHMLEVLRTRRAKADLIPAVVHVDGTARVQTLRADDNPLLARLVAAFHAMTGVPIVLNTSFNAKGEPIVATPIDALRCFWSTGLDVLIMGSFLLAKP
jgi:carbamoyltransferase